jgi:hypothetical protein
LYHQVAKNGLGRTVLKIINIRAKEITNIKKMFNDVPRGRYKMNSFSKLSEEKIF